MSYRTLVSAAALVLVAGVSACATSKSAESPPATAESQGPLVGPPEVAWADMTNQQKGRYMKEVVTPKMKDLFVAYDASEFSDMDCSTCHGKNAKERGFEMPNPDLPELPTTQEGWDELGKDHPEMANFMAKQVTPAMAQLLGKPQFDPNNPDPNAFGCAGCHPMAGGH